jgi:hypothetical protein
MAVVVKLLALPSFLSEACRFAFAPHPAPWRVPCLHALLKRRHDKISDAISHERFPAPRRCGSVACCNCPKQKSSISLGAAEAGVMLIKARQVTTVTHSGFTFAPPSAILSTDVPKRKKPGLKPGF